MITILLTGLTLATAPGACAPPVPAPAMAPVQEDTDAEFEKRRTEAGDDIEKLWQLHLWCKENGRSKDSDATLERIVELAPDNEDAHKALGHRFYDGKWFEGPIELSKYKRAQEKRMLEEHGLVRFKDDWVPKADVPFLRMGWTKAESGSWVSPAVAERLAREAKYREEGWQLQTDLVWVSPDEAAKWKENLWKCGEEWMPLEEANAFHARIGQGWTLPGEHFIVDSTLDYNSGCWAYWYCDQTFKDLARAYGTSPKVKPEVVVCRNLAQFNTLAAGDQNNGIQAVEGTGYSSLHYAYFAESWFAGTAQVPEYRGRGVAYWDVNDPNMRAWGQYSIRHAAGHSYAEAIDPSWDIISRAFTSGPQAFSSDGFWREKRIPMWFRYGCASYVERFLRDSDPKSENPWAFRDWAIGEVRNAGGVRPLEQLFAFRLDPNDPNTGRLISEAGLVVSFVLDGGCKPVMGAHAAFKQALREGEDTKETVAALQQAIVDNKAALNEYGGLEPQDGE